MGDKLAREHLCVSKQRAVLCHDVVREQQLRIILVVKLPQIVAAFDEVAQRGRVRPEQHSDCSNGSLLVELYAFLDGLSSFTRMPCESLNLVAQPTVMTPACFRVAAVPIHKRSEHLAEQLCSLFEEPPLREAACVCGPSAHR